jgi:hypothetical protein
LQLHAYSYSDSGSIIADAKWSDVDVNPNSDSDTHSYACNWGRFESTTSDRWANNSRRGFRSAIPERRPEIRRLPLQFRSRQMQVVRAEKNDQPTSKNKNRKANNVKIIAATGLSAGFCFDAKSSIC